MSDLLRLLSMMNIAIAGGGVILFILQRWFGKIAHRTSTVLFLLCLLMPLAGQMSPVKPIQEAKVSAQEFLGSTLSPPVLPEEGPVDSLPASSAEPEQTSTSPSIPWEKAMELFYLMGAVYFLGRFLFLYLRLQSDLRSCLQLKVFRNLRILVQSRPTSPFSTYQGLTPVVVLPQELLSSPERGWILRHEFQHIRQGDLLLTHFLELLTALCFLNPLFWWWKRSLTESMEFACDDRIITKYPQQRKDYAYALITVAENTLTYKSSSNLCAGMASLGRDGQSILTRRIKMIVTKKKIKPWQAITSAGFVALASTLAFSAGVPSKKKLPEELSESLRQKIRDSLLSGIRRSGATKGHAIITNPKTGKVMFAKGFSASGEELEDDYLSTPYSPHSLMKPIITALALEAGKTQLSTMHECKDGRLIIGGKEYKDYRNFEKLSTREAMVQSSNVCSIRVAQSLTNRELYEGLKNFGFGSGSVVKDFSGAAEGLLRQPSKSETEHFSANLTIGHRSIFTTPLEVTQAYGALFNGGELFEPSLSPRSKPGRRVISQKTSMDLRTVLSEVVQSGTGSNAKDPDLQIGGKTSSSPGAPYDLNNRMSFIGAAPAEDANYLVYVTLDGSEKGKSTGGKHAAPVVREILKILQ